MAPTTCGATCANGRGREGANSRVGIERRAGTCGTHMHPTQRRVAYDSLSDVDLTRRLGA